jgi:hypothetical protein
MSTITIDLQALQAGLYCVAIALSTVGAVKFFSMRTNGNRTVNSPEAKDQNQKTDSILIPEQPTWNTVLSSAAQEEEAVRQKEAAIAAESELKQERLIKETEIWFKHQVRVLAKDRGLPDHEYYNLSTEATRIAERCKKGELAWVSGFASAKSWINRRMRNYQNANEMLLVGSGTISSQHPIGSQQGDVSEPGPSSGVS